MRCLRAVVAVALLVAVAACSSTKLRPRAARTVRANDIVDASGAASVRGRTVHLMTPAGRVDLTLTAPAERVGGEAVDGAHPLQAADGTRLVGVSWVLQRAAYPDSPNRQLTEPYTIFGAPRPVTLWLVAGGTRLRIPGVDNLTTTDERPSNAVWVDVPATARTFGFALDYDGVTQTVDARTGRVDAGRAAPLYRPLPLNAHGYCDLGPDALGGCLMDYGIGYPYVTGVGWAPAGRTWLLLRLVSDEDDDGARNVTVAGSKPRVAVGDKVERFSPYLVDAEADTFAVRGYGTADTLRGGTKRLPLTGTLRRSAS